MAAYPSRADRRPISGIEELLKVRMDSNATGAEIPHIQQLSQAEPVTANTK